MYKELENLSVFVTERFPWFFFFKLILEAKLFEMAACFEIGTLSAWFSFLQGLKYRNIWLDMLHISKFSCWQYDWWAKNRFYNRSCHEVGLLDCKFSCLLLDGMFPLNWWPEQALLENDFDSHAHLTVLCQPMLLFNRDSGGKMWFWSLLKWNSKNDTRNWVSRKRWRSRMPLLPLNSACLISKEPWTPQLLCCSP